MSERKRGRPLVVLVPPGRDGIGSKVCTKCGEEKPLADFYVDEAKARHPTCAWTSQCKACQNARVVAHYRALRLAAIQKLGGACACCGESRYEFLAFDHINGRQKTGPKSSRMSIAQLKRILAGEAGDLRILCHNCNCARGFYGFCPHELEREETA